jgi:hypothetical protein
MIQFLKKLYKRTSDYHYSKGTTPIITSQGKSRKKWGQLAFPGYILQVQNNNKVLSNLTYLVLTL